MRIVVDFDGTLAGGLTGYITSAEPNYALIERLKRLKQEYECYIVVCTARGAKSNLSVGEKERKYYALIKQFLETYQVPFDEISFNKEYGDLYIDDMTIRPNDEFIPHLSPFTDNKILFTNGSVIKKSKSSIFEKKWYDIARLRGFNVPEVLFVNDETIITERISESMKPRVIDYINLIEEFRHEQIPNYPFQTYLDRLVVHPKNTQKVRELISTLPNHPGTFFHGDLSTTNVLKNERTWLIDPNYKNVFGSYLTDAGKTYFSLIAYNQDHFGAQMLVEAFGELVKHFAVAEGLRVSKYKPEYTSIINNIADEI
jgi:hypothetical protein